jgi:hypothetical protein
MKTMIAAMTPSLRNTGANYSIPWFVDSETLSLLEHEIAHLVDQEEFSFFSGLWLLICFALE